MPVGLDSESTDTTVPVELIQVATVAADGQIDVPAADQGGAAVGVDKTDRAVGRDCKAGNRATLRIRSVTELAILGHDGPAWCALVPQHRAARDGEGAVAIDHIRRSAACGL